MQVVIGIDPGRESGIGVVTIEAHPSCLLTAKYRVGNPRKSEPETPTDALNNILTAIGRLGYKVKVAAIEDQYVHKNWRSAISLAQTAGRWQEACCVCSVPVVKVEPAQWQSTTVMPFKKAFGMTGKVDSRLAKNLAIRVADTIGAQPGISQDESEAVCIALDVARREYSRAKRK